MNPYAISDVTEAPTRKGLAEVASDYAWLIIVIGWVAGLLILDASDDNGFQLWQEHCPTMIRPLRSQQSVLIGYLLLFCSSWIAFLFIGVSFVCAVIFCVAKATVATFVLTRWLTRKLIFSLLFIQKTFQRDNV
ncbi:hypothetical protein [Rhodopirellula baltica]|uniref:Transmembrane protein n=1 Tax=Rhodopirellula baltica SWK14 TaxID=993516 RepID=L7CNK0_RHOBT|nr:hypothetical protein [Rhodopirellula baltica]ELP34636.1 hypothetical protein RBSWK_01423 [Rhodopirellula baltica SWK14]